MSLFNKIAGLQVNVLLVKKPIRRSWSGSFLILSIYPKETVIGGGWRYQWLPYQLLTHPVSNMPQNVPLFFHVIATSRQGGTKWMFLRKRKVFTQSFWRLTLKKSFCKKKHGCNLIIIISIINSMTLTCYFHW